MDFSESTQVVYSRIQKLEPENVTKIIGYLLLNGHGEHDMIRLAFSPDNLIHSLINKAKAALQLSSKSEIPSPTSPLLIPSPVNFHLHSKPISPVSPHPFPSPVALGTPSSFLDHQTVDSLEFIPPAYSDSVADDYRLQNQLQFLCLEDQFDPVNSVNSDFSGSYYFPESAIGTRTNRRSPSLPEFPVKVCHYFSKGYCKHGDSCRYFHGHPVPESLSQIFSTSPNEHPFDDHVISPRSLEKLEREITELLKLRRGFPISIASLPMMYFEKYGRTLQAEGYLTESQRHGKAGYSLTKLLARLKNSIRLIDRPHGQHSVILVEDVPKYMDYNSERNEHGGIVAGSRQIYLTFPAESTFTEQDVSNYFNKFGPVQDVRIPCQQKRMFGFVTFVFAETVKQILTKGNPHFVCGARVLVKPYREKSRVFDRKFAEKGQHPLYYGSQFTDAECELNYGPRVCDNSRLLRKQFMEEHEQVLELERRRLSEFQLGPKAMNPHNLYYDRATNDLKISEARADQVVFPYAERFNYLLDVLNNGSGSDDKVRHLSTSYNDPDSCQGLDLPDSPFASPIRGMSTVI